MQPRTDNTFSRITRFLEKKFYSCIFSKHSLVLVACIFQYFERFYQVCYFKKFETFVYIIENDILMKNL